MNKNLHYVCHEEHHVAQELKKYLKKDLMKDEHLYVDSIYYCL